jgi:hypothetical protein
VLRVDTFDLQRRLPAGTYIIASVVFSVVFSAYRLNLPGIFLPKIPLAVLLSVVLILQNLLVQGT